MSSPAPEGSPPSPPSDSSSSPPSPDSSSSPPPPDSSSAPPPPDSSSPPPPPDSTSPPPPSDSSGGGGGGASTPPPGKSPSPPPPSDKDSPPSDGGSGSGNKSPSKSGGSSDDDGDSRSTPTPPRSGKNDDSPSRGNAPPPLPDSSSKHDSSDNQKAIVAGAAAAVGLLFLLMIVFMISCAKRKKRKGRDDMKYYKDNNSRPNNTNNNYYNNGGPSWQNNKAPSPDHMVKIPLPPGSTGVNTEENWGMAPPPVMSSSEMSSAGFSGPRGAPLPPPHPAVALGFNQSSFTYEDLAAATGGFTQSNLLGQGGFGYVHKGVLPNGKEVAVKSLKVNSGQGEREFQAEVDIISRVHHRHLVSLVGHCSAGTQRLLVYEFVDNGTLEYHLHGPGRPTMDWPTRLKIALGSAKGFAYLHEDCHPRIIHRDIKAANILIDKHFEAKVADFGLAKLSSDNYTHVSTRIMGTFGYLAPEYAASGKLTEKSDVYSFGIMLLELITGRRPIDINSDDDDCLVDWARPILIRITEGGGSYEELVDPKLGNNYNHYEMVRVVASAAACIRHSARRRPKMSQIVRALEGDVSLDDLNEGVKAAHNTLFGSSGASDYDVKRIGKGGTLTSQEFSSEDGQTGEFVRTSGGSSQEVRSGLGRTHTP